MKTIKISVWVNVLLYVTLLCFAAWLFFKIAVVVAPRFPEAPMSGKLFVISHFAPVLLFHTLPVLSIIGLLRKKNWGRILTIILNIFFVIIVAGNVVLDIVVANDVGFLPAISSQKAFLVYIFAISFSFIALTVILLRKEAKLYFKTSKA
ncbi:MAG: hypothetical protein JXA50_11995 [Deltaproteobacteria bacterium]|nr:hypothetical protein [Deltaproteobacteria bacterium]